VYSRPDVGRAQRAAAGAAMMNPSEFANIAAAEQKH
jgi:hypothetical protein